VEVAGECRSCATRQRRGAAKRRQASIDLGEGVDHRKVPAGPTRDAFVKWCGTPINSTVTVGRFGHLGRLEIFPAPHKFLKRHIFCNLLHGNESRYGGLSLIPRPRPFAERSF